MKFSCYIESSDRCDCVTFCEILSKEYATYTPAEIEIPDEYRPEVYEIIVPEEKVLVLNGEWELGYEVAPASGAALRLPIDADGFARLKLVRQRTNKTDYFVEECWQRWKVEKENTP